jgi:hypothetical protein
VDRRIHLRDAWAVIWEIAIRILLDIGSSNDCDAVGISAKLEQLVHPSPMSFRHALMRTTHTGLRAGRDRLERLYLNCHYEDSLIEKAG